MDADQIERGRRFAALHRDGCFLLPNAWDVGSARLLATAGFPALATTSAGIAFSLGRPDHPADGPAGRVERDVMMRRVADIAGAVAVPVSADLEEGYGAAPETVAETITMAIAAGVVGGNIEDYTADPDRPLVDVGLGVERIRAARAAVDADGGPFVLVGRTDAALVGGTIAECVDRANAYLAAGADCAFVPGFGDAASIATLVRELDGPLNVVMGLSGGAMTLDQLRDLGVRRVTVGGSIARAMYGHLLRAAREMAERGTFGYAADQISQADLNDLFRPAGRA